MTTTQYRVTESVYGLTEGDLLTVIGRYGPWHPTDLELEVHGLTTPKKVIVSEGSTGFSEENILDPTARFGDWHKYDLAFEPGAYSSERTMNSSGPAYITSTDFRRIATPV